MNILWITIPITFLLGFGFLIAYGWAARSGQFDDLDSAAARVFNDDEKKERSE